MANLVPPHLVGESCLSKSNFVEKFDGQGFVRRSTTPCKPGAGVLIMKLLRAEFSVP